MKLSKPVLQAIIIGAVSGLVVVWLTPLMKRLPPKERE